MDPNSSPWAYAYNRIVPSASGSSDDFQHTHLAQISAAAGSSAQSLLLQAAHSSIAGFNATSGNFVPPTPIGGYNPVFQQIYHHAAQAAVQPKPAHYASSAVSTSHRHLGLSGTVEKQEICRSQPAALGYTTNQSINIPTSSYYGENSSSSGASPSPTTSATSSTTLSWNTPVIGTPQQMSANTFLTMHQQQQQAQQQATLNQVEKVINSKQSNLQIQMKGHSKNYEDLIYVGNHQQEHEENTLQLDNQIIQAVSEEDCARSEEGFYTFVDGKLTYNIPAAAISSASLPNKMPVSSIKVVTPRKHSTSESHHPTLQQGLRQIPSPAYPIYESPSLCSSVGSPPPAVNSVRNNESANNSSHNNVYKSNTPTQQAQTSLDVSNVGRGANSNNNRNNNFARNSVSNSSLSPTTSVGYSSVITSAFQAQQQQQLQQEHHQMQQSVCWPGSSTNKLSDISKHDQKVYSIHSPHAQENNIYILPPSLQIKRTIIETVQQSSELPQPSPQVHQQMVENALHVMSSQRDAAKQQPRNQLQTTEPQQIVQSKQQHSVENVLATNNSQASQIQNTSKVEEVQKPIPTKKAPRKRQPKKTLLQNNDFSRTSQQNPQTLQQPSRQQQQQQIQHHQPQQQQQQVQQQQQQQHNSSFYDYNNRWMQPKVENNINIPTFGNNQSQQTNPVPQPAHVQSSQTHPHISQISQYYPAFPQHVSTQYAACMSQNTNLYNLTPLGQDTQQEQQQQQNVNQNAQDSLQQQNTSEEVQTEPAAESLSCKVIVPNIEDELHFLTTSDPKLSSKVQSNSIYGRDSTNLKTTLQKQSSAEAINTYPPFEKKDGPGKKSAFMDSYLKFLQGERDESPPPLMKTGRKYNYQKPCMQKEYVNSNKRKSNDNSHSSNTSSVTENTLPEVEGSTAPVTNNEGTVTGSDDGHKIKIISQTQILPKKRPQAQNMAAVIQQNPANSEEASQQHQAQQQQLRVSEQQHSQQYRQIQPQTQNFHQDPLALPPRREQSLRKAKARGINEIMQATPAVTDRDEPEEFADSDADPVWTPQDDDSEDGMPGNFAGKRKNRRIKPNFSSKKKDSSALKDDSTLENDVNKIALVSSTSNNISENTSGNAVDNFKTGDFIVLRSDLVNDWPIIWQVDSKCILQKYESFCQNGKMFYRNMSKYASWNLDTKKLYIKAPVRIQVQSHTETIVEFMRSELLADDTEQFIEKIMEDYLTYRDHFEIYIQTMISQVLDPSFFSEINREKDEYFLSSVRTIDEIMENCKRKLLSITPWTRSVIVSIETWPQCHVFTEWGQNNVNQKNCGGCHQPGISVRFLLFGHPYNTNTMQTIPVDMRVAYEKDILLCRICAARADIFHKIAHEKYNLFAICTRRVGEHQKELPGKSSTDILNDLLAENNWVDELFRNMRSSWAEVESLERQKRFHEVSQ